MPEELPSFTPPEREAIRHEFMTRYGGARSIHQGFHIKRWATGEKKGQPKPLAVIQGMIERGLLKLDDDGGYWLKASFTDSGLRALKRLGADSRSFHGDLYAELRAEIEQLPDAS